MLPALPSKPEWIKNKSIYKNSSTGSRATSISSLNSALSLNMNLGSSAGPSSEASPSKSSSSNFHEVSTASSSAVSPNLPALHWTPAGYAWPRGSSGLASDPLGDEPAQADQLRKPTIVIKSRGDTPEPYRQPGAASLPHSSSSESLSPTQHLAGLQKATSVSQNAPSSREGVIKPTPVRSSSA